MMNENKNNAKTLFCFFCSICVFLIGLENAINMLFSVHGILRLRILLKKRWNLWQEDGLDQSFMRSETTISVTLATHAGAADRDSMDPRVQDLMIFTSTTLT